MTRIEVNMIDFNRMIIGTEEFNVPITTVDIVHDYINLNNGCIIAYTFDKHKGYTWYYDKVGGPEIKSDRIYIWNSTVKGRNGKIKRTFVIKRDELKQLVWNGIDDLFESKRHEQE